MEGKIKFQIEADKVLKLLSNEIYDSPYALLRENVQNAYDAILMRLHKESNFSPRIDIVLDGKNVTIADNGIGMTREIVENNYWKAGSSGKNNEDARKAGVVGTFGIGAMANFGICTHLKVETHYWGENVTISSEVDKANLSLSVECILIDKQIENKEPGTKVYATLDDCCDLDNQVAIQYLQPYVQYLEMPVYFNGTIISQKTYHKKDDNTNIISSIQQVLDDDISFRLEIQIQKYSGGAVSVYIDNLLIGKNSIGGDIFLEQGANNYIYGLRNSFGLAPIPVNSIFYFGGIVNLSVLQPTAGREALSRESTAFVSRIVSLIECKVAEELSKYDIADSNRYFLAYIFNKRMYERAGKIKIQMRPGNTQIAFENVSSKIEGKEVFFYSGTDSQIIEQYANENTSLLTLSADNPRRNIQIQMLSLKKVPQIPDKPSILREYTSMELNTAEFALTLRLMSTLKDDYLIGDAKIIFADISHQVPNMVEQINGLVVIYLSRKSGNVQQVLKIYDADQNLFDGFVKDFVRNHLYPKLAPFVPSSTREGADALYRILQRNKELYTIESDEMGDVEALMTDYVAGKKDLKEIIRMSSQYQNTQKQTVSQNQVGTVEQELSTVIQNPPLQDHEITIDETMAIPPIRISSDTAKKILKTNVQYSQLNNNTCFLALSDKIFERQLDFFLQPHTTKIIWGMHKILYMFTHASSQLTLYYEIELKHKLQETQTGGQNIPTTTIISKNRLFVPIIPELIPYFDIQEQLSFYVRYDLITDLI